MYCVMASTRTVALVVVLSSFSSPVVFGHTHDAQSALERYQNAVTLANGGHHAQAREVYAQLLANYPGQLEFAMGFAKSCVASNVPEQLFVKLQHMSQIFIGKIFESGSRISERRSIAKYLKEFDANTQKAIFMLQSKPVSPQNVYTLRMWRGNILHGVSLAMLSTDSRSQWGRRMMTLAHTTKMAAVAEVEPGGICRGRSDGQGKGHTDVEGRQLVWGWEQKVLLANDDDVTVTRIVLPRYVDVNNDFLPTYDVGPHGQAPAFASTTHVHQGANGTRTATRYFNDVRSTYLVELRNVYLNGHAATDAMWGVYYTACSVFSMSKLHNCIIFQQYTGHASDTVTIDDPVISIVYPSLDNFYHMLVEALPKVLTLLAETRHGRQLPFLAQAPYGPSTKILAPDLAMVRKVLVLAGVDLERDVRWITSRADTRYLLRRCVLVEFGPLATKGVDHGPDGGRIPWPTRADTEGKPRAAVKTLRDVWYPDLSTKTRDGVVPVVEGDDAWDGTPGYGEDMWATYRAPQAAMQLLRRSLLATPPTPSADTADHRRDADSSAAIGASDPEMDHSSAGKHRALPVVVYLQRLGASSRAVQGLGEDALVQALSRALHSTAVLKVHTGQESAREQLDMMSSAAVVVGGHGAGMANVLWQTPGTALVRFPLLPEIERCFEYMAATVGLLYYEVPELSTRHSHHYNLTAQSLEAIVRTVQDALHAVAARRRDAAGVSVPFTAPPSATPLADANAVGHHPEDL
eukprot:m.1604811 g.1604811  ORF g.1604811 m.1604811 type:complete len:748 (-) comp25358_c0_seq21:4830-7073(-)